MRPYEVMIIFDAGLEEDVIRAAVDRFSEVIRASGGNPGRVDTWGKRRFAYELHHRWEGYYVLLELTGEPSVVDELGRVLHLADEVIRHKVVRVPDKVAGRSRRPAEPVGAAATSTADPEANGA
ncbi:MAG: 30S ribosomal protein S6 [Acidimicrobiales bacterium]